MPRRVQSNDNIRRSNVMECRFAQMSAFARLADVQSQSQHVGAKLGNDGLSFRIFNALRGRAFFPDRQREAQLLPNITQRGCA
jgi:hypothetical protein